MLNVSIEQNASELVPCGTYYAKALDPRPVLDSLGGAALLDLISVGGFKTPATRFGAPEPLDPIWCAKVTVTPEVAKKICEGRLTTVYFDWSGAPYDGGEFPLLDAPIQMTGALAPVDGGVSAK